MCPLSIKYGQYSSKGKEHRGTDIALSTGDSIRSAFDGVVRVKEVTRTTGGMEICCHPASNGLETYYGHLSRFLVDTGDVVKAGSNRSGGNTAWHRPIAF